MKILILLSVITLIASCQTIAVVPQLPLPEKPVLPAIVGDDLSCLSDEAYTALVRRDKLQDNYINTLRTIIETTHE